MTTCHASVRRVGPQLRAFCQFIFDNGEQLVINGCLVRVEDGITKVLLPLAHTGSDERITAVFLPDSWYKILRAAVVDAMDPAR